MMNCNAKEIEFKNDSIPEWIDKYLLNVQNVIKD